MGTADQLASVIAKLDALRAKDSGLLVFGASSHGYSLNPPVSSDELAEVEGQIGRALPEDYREFLLTVGNGGAGPFYGLLPLGENEGVQVNLTVDFPFTLEAPYRWNTERTDDYEERIENAENDAVEQALWDELSELENADYLRAIQGITFLDHEGCGIMDVLVLRGEAYGQVWLMDFANDLGMYPILSPDTGRPMSFLDWYELWLDRSLDGSFGSWMGTDLICP